VSQLNTDSKASDQRQLIRSGRFRSGRESSWRELESIVSKLEKKSVRSLSAREAMELPKLYQALISSLAVARNTILDKNLIQYLENLSLRSYLAVYGPQGGLLQPIANFFRSDFPQCVRSLKAPIIISGLSLLAGILVGFIAVLVDPMYYSLIVDPQIASGRDFSASPEELRSKYLDAPYTNFEQNFIFFANFLFRHNTIVSLMCFGLGFLAGLPTIILIFTNGLLLGAMLALHFDKGLMIEFVAWLSVHGITELTAVVLAGGGGLAIGASIVFPGQWSRRANLADKGLKASKVMIGAIIMLFIASILEGGFRQLIVDTFSRLIIGFMTLVFWWYYFFKAFQIDPKKKS
jgi:uncharacterized membrane protein SpoIIM required for sporulation